MKGEEKWEASFRENNMTFIPAKEVLSNNYNLSAAVERGNVKFDDTYLDILSAAKVDVSEGRNEKEKSLMLRKIEKIIGGKVVYDAEQDQFFLKIGNAKQEFNLVSEGIRKLALLWTLVKNGALEDGSVFFWDEPEANINPSAIPLIAEILLMLQRHNVQIYIATHDYFLTKYLEVSRKKDDCIRYHSLYIDDKKNRLRAGGKIYPARAQSHYGDIYCIVQKRSRGFMEWVKLQYKNLERFLALLMKQICLT